MSTTIVQKICKVIKEGTAFEILESFGKGEKNHKPKKKEIAIPKLLAKYLKPKNGDRFNVFFNKKGQITGMDILKRKTIS